MIRLKDIAERAGVSIMTVSKALRDAPDISAATKAHIRRLADEMGYMPHFLAQGLRSKSTRLFGLVISAVTNPIFARTVSAIEEAAFQRGYSVILGHSLNLPEREEQLIRSLLWRRVEGLFLSPVYRLEPQAPIYEELWRRRVPTVLLGHRAPFCSQFPSVETDDVAGSALATRHLLELGHRRIAFLAGSQVNPYARQRYEGYRRALREWQLDVDERLIYRAGSTIEEGEQAARQMIQEGRRPTAVQAVNDLVAIGAAQALLQAGLRIPQDVSVVGFGNVLVSEHFRVPLTTVRQPKFRLGQAAVQMMERLLQGQPAEPARLPLELVVRDSTAPPAASPPG